MQIMQEQLFVTLQPHHCRYLITCGFCYLVLTHPETAPCMMFLGFGFLRHPILHPCSRVRRLVVLRLGFLLTTPRGIAIAIG